MEGKGDDGDDVAKVLAPSEAIAASVLTTFAHRELDDLFNECCRTTDDDAIFSVLMKAVDGWGVSSVWRVCVCAPCLHLPPTLLVRGSLVSASPLHPLLQPPLISLHTRSLLLVARRFLPPSPPTPPPPPLPLSTHLAPRTTTSNSWSTTPWAMQRK